MPKKKKLALSMVLASSLLMGLAVKPAVAEMKTQPDNPNPKSTSFVFPESLVTSYNVAHTPTVNANGLYLMTQTQSAPQAVAEKEVVMTDEEISDAVYNSPSYEDIQQDPQEDDHYAPPIEDTLPDIDSDGVVSEPSQPDSSSEPSSSIEDSSDSSSSDNSSSESSSESSSSQPKPPQISNGWYTDGGERYYYYNGKPVTGWQTIGGRKYYFAQNGVLSSKVGIDVSVFQGNIDWNKVKADGIDFVIMRAGYRGWGTGKIVKDSKFEEYYRGATAAGLEVGVYFYSQAITEQEAVDEAKFVLELLKTHPIDGPVAFDIEGSYESESRVNDPSITNQDRTNFAKAFCSTIRSAGYVPQVYTYLSYAYNYMYMDQLTNYQTWIAHYTSSNVTSYANSFKCWQYTSSGSVNGINAKVDMNVRLM